MPDAETREFWDRVANDWDKQVGNHGDRNRLLSSDPVLWDFTGDVSGLRVLDAGCGTGYLSRQLAQKGAAVTGVDFSKRMIEIARGHAPGIEFHIDSCSELRSLGDEQFDLLIANYVLMDLPDLPGTIRAFHRVLKPGGRAVLVFSHPCFPAGRATPSRKGLAYRWDEPYFEAGKRIDPPWGHWFHRPLSDYWKSFFDAGFRVTGFEEPRLTADRAHLALNERERERSSNRPYSVAFRLEKPQ